VRLARELTDAPRWCAVVKADGYGHGAAPAARAALAAARRGWPSPPPTRAAELRAEGIDARLLVMGALTGDELDIASRRTRVVAWRVAWLRDALGTATRACTSKLDTGMGRSARATATRPTPSAPSPGRAWRA